MSNKTVQKTLDDNMIKTLAERAVKARELSYCPYSGFAVGAALLTSSGEIFTGVNIENSGYSATNCAERTAFFKAISEGQNEFVAIAIAGGKKGENPSEECPPCGVCRQVMREFCSDDFEVIFVSQSENGELKTSVHILKEVLPYSFGPENLG